MVNVVAFADARAHTQCTLGFLDEPLDDI